MKQAKGRVVFEISAERRVINFLLNKAQLRNVATSDFLFGYPSRPLRECLCSEVDFLMVCFAPVFGGSDICLALGRMTSVYLD